MYRKFDAKIGQTVLTIFAGECYVSSQREIISTVLGSCVAVCLYDQINQVGGMNHFMLPQDKGGPSAESLMDMSADALLERSMRYGVTAMEVLVAQMQKKGAQRKNLRAKIFGGGNVLSRLDSSESVGDKNIGFARAFLKLEQIPIDTESVGDRYGRKIFFLTGENKVFVKRVEIEQALTEERSYMKKLSSMKKQGDVTIF